MMCTVNNLDNFQTNSVVHRMNTRAKHQLHRTTVNLSCIKKGVFYSNIKILNSVLPYMLELTQEKPKFKVALRQYLIAHTCLSVSQNAFPL